jgi:hypothetical protein
MPSKTASRNLELWENLSQNRFIHKSASKKNERREDIEIHGSEEYEIVFQHVDIIK